jgi:protein-S-isoprenylcysteine O-methyltransferase Ste14
MGRILSVSYGIAAYAAFLVTILYAIGFVGGWLIPKSLDTGEAAALGPAIAVNLSLLGLFAVQHSGMARPAFKRWWTRFVPPALERSTFVLFSSLVLALLFWQWRPLPQTLWHVANPSAATLLSCVSLLGWAIAFLSTFLIHHFELFGLRQVLAAWAQRRLPPPTLKTPLFYRYVRHPLYFGFLIAFWATPHMSAGHLLFAAATTGYILLGIQLEERDLIEQFGNQYRSYRQRVNMLLPGPPRGPAQPTAPLDESEPAPQSVV